MASTAIDIPFGVQNGISAESTDIDISFGKLYTGGMGVYLFVQNKIRKISVSSTTYGSCAGGGGWIVLGIDKNSSAMNNPSTPTKNVYPLEQFSASYQEEPSIIWKSNPASGTTGSWTPDEVTAAVDPNTIRPATAVDCIIIMGINANFQVSVKGPDNAMAKFDPVTFIGSASSLGIQTNYLPASPSWNKSHSEQRQRADWQVTTTSGKGYIVGANLTNEIKNANLGHGIVTPATPRKTYYAISVSVTSKGDATLTNTSFEILDQ